MSQTIENYIHLEVCQKPYYEPSSSLDKKSSWHIYYDTNEQCFVCRNLSGEKFTKMKYIENFLKIWIDDMSTAIRSPLDSKITLYIQGKFYSDCYFITGREPPVGIVLRYASTLKDII